MSVHIEHCMGTVVSIEVRDPGDWTAALAEVVGWLHRVDALFSTYKAGSDVSRLARGELRLADAAPEVATVLDRCATLTAATDGWFSALIGGRLDPTGLVKGWAIEYASDVLRRHGSAYHAVNGGGDIQCAGGPWVVGVSDPADRTRVLARVAGHDLAVATSGVAERGAHVLDPYTGRPATALRQVTVTGPRLTEVDAYATAALAMGEPATSWVESQPGYQALAVTAAGGIRRTSGF